MLYIECTEITKFSIVSFSELRKTFCKRRKTNKEILIHLRNAFGRFQEYFLSSENESLENLVISVYSIYGILKIDSSAVTIVVKNCYIRMFIFDDSI